MCDATNRIKMHHSTQPQLGLQAHAFTQTQTQSTQIPKLKFSIRILKLDNYLTAPVEGLDDCLLEPGSQSNYSEVCLPVSRV
ncbi:hypothetical protein SARC_04207 [Sphaeroforma arctica JP610]|uniref:Uncharacterized protein n=1 Tax=Sphaeroforma arctica JP610 TaxID=667725 RepID=A0A0L0G3V1_9EUKA|nr:hypothetical protein SARC_04207 [Sphaeroforma arctica JP610]KNC83534.1 hypothetical protein SARC_04207 [Sphaeroforma arctica JP610]|eukprot:XP_014157436.1 hypothetical protein SARC_04207 [Sphaeroforma arctica JP610]